MINYPLDFPDYEIEKLVNGTYEEAELAAVLPILDDYDRVLECGAGIGYLASRLTPLVRQYVGIESNALHAGFARLNAPGATIHKDTLGPANLNRYMALYRPTVLLLDMEGAEVDILEEAVLRDVRAVVAELHPQLTRGEDVRILELIEIMSRHGFTLNHWRSKRIWEAGILNYIVRWQR